jgi:hypothetical protein
MNADNLFARLVSFTHGEVDRTGECHIPCPACGHPSSPRNPHASFDAEHGFHCFVCGQGYSLPGLAKAVGLDDNTYIPPPPTRIEKPVKNAPSWLKNAQDYLDGYTSDLTVYDRWQAYKPLDPDLIRAYRLGVGVLPPYSSRCPHPRLIVPLLAGGEIRGFRGRSLGCDCGKWLSASTMADWTKFLFNGGCLVQDQATARERNLGYSNSGYARGETLLILENPADAILAEQKLGVWAVATLGVTIWRDDWTQSLIECKPSSIVVGYDADMAGNLRTPQMEREWLAKNPKARTIPIPNGVRLVNHLLKAGLPASLFRWPKTAPPKCDIGQVLQYI